MSAEFPSIAVRSSPHIKRELAVETIMRNVVYALLPVAGFAVYAFGLSALALLLTTTAVCVLTEHLICRVSGKATTVSDWSVVITGLILGLTLPPGLPLWMAAVGSVFAVGIGKAVFGGLGFNTFNPALVGRAFLQASFPVWMTTWTPAFVSSRFTAFIPSTLAAPFMKPPSVDAYVKAVDGFTGATPLSLWKFQGALTEPLELFAGMTAGSVGETCSVLILICGLYLALRGMMNWRIPAGMLGAAAVFSGIFFALDPNQYPNPLFMLFSGGMMLGAVFMASDMVASPLTNRGMWIYGIVIGLLTVLIRLKGGLPEGVMYAILIGNALSPIIDQLTQYRPYGAKETAVTE